MQRPTGALRYTFYTVSSVTQLAPGRLLVATAPRPLRFEYEPASARVTIEAVPMTDSIMQHNWGKTLYRIVLDVDSQTSGSARFRFVADAGTR